MGKVYQIQKEKFEPLKKHLKKLCFKFEVRKYQVFLARYDKFTVNLFESGKITFGGKNPELQREVEWFVKKIGGNADDPVSYIGLEGKNRIGTDEVGKGDFFGPLVVAGALVTTSNEKRLSEAGVKDSKLIHSDKSISRISKSIIEILGKNSCGVVLIGPERYNELYEDFENLNKILGWAHARAIENLLQINEDCNLAIADQFGDEKYIKKALMAKGRKIELVQIHKGGRDLAIAAASILARDRFIRYMDEMSMEFDFKFLRGASKEVESAARLFVDEYGREDLSRVAKMHFSIAERI